MNKYNLLKDEKLIVAEDYDPVLIQEVKDYLRLEGFIDDIDSPSSDYDDDDTLIGELITSARQRLEAFTGLSFIPKTYQIEICNLAGDFVIPYGPITEIVSVEDTSGTALTYTTTINLSKLKTPVQDDIVVEYECDGAGAVHDEHCERAAVDQAPRADSGVRRGEGCGQDPRGRGLHLLL